MNEIFCKHLLEYRKRAGYSQKDMSGKLLIEESLYSQYENGTAEPGFDALIRIADVLKCSLDELFGRSGDYKRDTSGSSVMLREEAVQYGSPRAKKKVLIGLQDFRRVRELHAYYVDKTMMIGEFLNSPYQITLITRPRRFGKTMNMSMLAEFLDCTKDSKAIFEGSNISRTEWMVELNQCPVIFLSFLNTKSDCSKGLFELIGETVTKEYERYYSLINDSMLSDREKEKFNKIYRALVDIRNMESWRICIIESIRTLCEVLSIYYGKNVYLLIDEYDTPFMSANMSGYYSEVRSVLAGFLSTSLKGNPYLERAMLTGIQRVAKENIFSGLNNLTVLTVNDSEYEDCFGFTEEEVRKLLDDFDLELTDEVKEMYDGYRFGNKDIYNPWSAINYAVRKRLAPYWVNTAENSILKDALRERGTTFEKEYNKLIETGEITTVVSLTTAYYEHQSDASLWGLMVNAGMLDKVDDVSAITTQEVSDALGGIEINECANVGAVTAAVSEGSNEVGTVYKSDTYGLEDKLEILQVVGYDLTGDVIYPVAQIKNDEADDLESEAALDFLHFLTSDKAKEVYEKYLFDTDVE